MSVRCKSDGYVGARRAMIAALKRTSGGGGGLDKSFCKGLLSLVCTINIG